MEESNRLTERRLLIEEYQALLANWRFVLRTLLGTQLALPPEQVSNDVALGVARARQEISTIKDYLRVLGAPANDQYGDVDIPDLSEVQHQFGLLRNYRRTLSQLQVQRLQFASQGTPPHIAHGIAEARAAIAQIEAQLRQWGLPLGDCVDE
jgi:hypothetical protein